MATAVVLLCDGNFLVPTIGTAIAARSQISDPAVGIFVYVLDRDDEGLGRLRQVLDAHAGAAYRRRTSRGSTW